MNVFQSQTFASLSAIFPFFVFKTDTMPPVIMLAAMSARTQDPAAIQSKQQVPRGSLWLYREVVHQSKHRNPDQHNLDYNLDLRPTPVDCETHQIGIGRQL